MTTKQEGKTKQDGKTKMSVQKLERVLWRLRKTKPESNKFTNHALRQAIMFECGTDPQTYRNNRKALGMLGWISSQGTKYVILTNNDITGD